MICPNRLDPEDAESAECGDEGRPCPVCAYADEKRWREYFGLTPGMTKREHYDQLERMRPYVAPEEAGE